MKNKNILIKIGGSLLAPKNSEEKRFESIKYLSEIIKKFPDKNFFIINGTGNVGHNFVKNNDLNKGNILILQENLRNFFNEVDKTFFRNGIDDKNFYRFETNKIYLNKKKFFNRREKFSKRINIFGGDILNSGKIISSDEIFGDFIDFFNQNGEIFSGYFAGDTDGVLNSEGKTIQEINLKDFNKIEFFEKKGDSTGGMKNKFLELFGKKFNEIIIFNGSKFDNWNNIFLKKIKKLNNFTKIFN